jgi:hypothetical protein
MCKSHSARERSRVRRLNEGGTQKNSKGSREEAIAVRKKQNLP